MVWTIKFSRNALKDAQKLRSANLTSNVNQLIDILKQNPYQREFDETKKIQFFEFGWWFDILETLIISLKKS